MQVDIDMRCDSRRRFSRPGTLHRKLVFSCCLAVSTLRYGNGSTQQVPVVFTELVVGGRVPRSFQRERYRSVQGR